MLEHSRHDDVTRIECSTPVSRAFGYRVSVYVVRDVLIDTGFPRVSEPLMAALAARRPRGALVTHYHEDHAGNVGALTRLGIPVGMAPATRELVRDPKPIGLYRRVCWGVAAPLERDPEPFEDPALRLLPAPGHTTDHHVVWDLERETMFGGDLFIGVKVRIAHPNEDLRQQVRTLRAMAALRPKRFFDGHRGLLPDAVGLLTAKADWIDRVIGSVEGLARQGWPDTTIAAEVLGRGDFTGWFSRGDYSKLNLVRAIRASMD
jgi:glyoxylase-like metal-dependent hydrolase (beta-lactamase superfamily II)